MWENLLEYSDGKLFWKVANNRRAVGEEAGCPHHTGYHVFQYDNKQYRTHRVIWELHNGPIPDDKVIDHINRDRSDNRIENLRLVTTQLNRTNNGAKGYRYFKGKWQVQLHRNGKSHYLGRFDTELEAQHVVARFKEEYDLLNFQAE